MPRKRYDKSIEAYLPKGWEVTDVEGEYAIVRMHIGDLKRVKMMKVPAEAREYFRQTQQAYRERLRMKGKR